MPTKAEKEAADKKAAEELEAEEKAAAEEKAKAEKEAADKKAAEENAKASPGKGTNVTSNYSSPLGLPCGGPVIPPGKTVKVENWATIKEHSVVKAWLKAEVISAK